MDIKIERVDVSNIPVLESNSFIDLSKNLWRLDVTKFKIYIYYLGKVQDRVAKFRIISPEGFELLADNTGIFSVYNDMEYYYRVRGAIKGLTTVNIWKVLQHQITHTQYI